MATRRYSIQGGFFLQDDLNAKAPEDHSGGIPPRFGLIDDSNERWVTFKRKIDELDKNALPGTQYKVIFLGRHGEGHHNVAMNKYDMEEWRRNWSRLNGDGELVWGPDPKLTELGMEQARDVNRVWKEEIEHDIPPPDKLYCSPLSRAIKTNQLTFKDVIRSDQRTTIVENIREKNGVSTCDKRGRKSEIERDFPEYIFESGFTEEDETWDVGIRETPNGVEDRARKTLDMIFENDEGQFISITSHHAFIDAFLQVSGHRPWNLPTGGVIPMVVRADQTTPN